MKKLKIIDASDLSDILNYAYTERLKALEQIIKEKAGTRAYHYCEARAVAMSDVHKRIMDRVGARINRAIHPKTPKLRPRKRPAR